jgi:hypothetical protein
MPRKPIFTEACGEFNVSIPTRLIKEVFGLVKDYEEGYFKSKKEAAATIIEIGLAVYKERLKSKKKGE